MYRGAYLVAVAGIACELVSGRLASYIRAFQAPQAAPADFSNMVLTAGIWLIAIGPLSLLAYDLGSQHTEARRVHTAFWRGLIESWRVAWGRPRLSDMAEEFSEPPADDVSAAVLYGLGIGATPLVLFLSVIPTLRTVRGVIWIGGAAVLFGIIGYCHRRAAAYIRDEPGRWSAFRQWSLLNPDRFQPEGRVFVRAQIVCTVLLPVWWLGGAALLVG